MNNVMLIGRLVRNVEVHENEAKTIKWCNNALAIKRGVKDQSGEYQTDFIDIKFLNKSCDVVGRYAHKGDQIAVYGELNVDTYQNKEGKTSKSVYVLVKSVELLSNKSEAKQEQEPTQEVETPTQKQDFDYSQVDENDLPF